MKNNVRVIARACKPESDSSQVKKKKGVTDKISAITEKLDALGKSIVTQE